MGVRTHQAEINESINPPSPLNKGRKTSLWFTIYDHRLQQPVLIFDLQFLLIRLFLVSNVVFDCSKVVFCLLFR